MPRLPDFVCEPLTTLAATNGSGMPGSAAALADAAARLLETERWLGELAVSVDAMREAMRGQRLLEESRSGQRVYDIWSGLCHRFLSAVVGGSRRFTSADGDLQPAPAGFEALGARWERAVPEVEALVREHEAMEQAFGERPLGAHVGYRFRSRLLLLDHRAARVKVAVDLIRRDLVGAARAALGELTRRLAQAPDAAPGAGGES